MCVHVCKVDPPIPAALGTGKKNEVLENIFGTWGEVVNGIRGGGQRRGDIGGGATVLGEVVNEGAILGGGGGGVGDFN